MTINEQAAVNLIREDAKRLGVSTYDDFTDEQILETLLKRRKQFAFLIKRYAL